MSFLLLASIFLLVMVLMNVYTWLRFLRLLTFDKKGYLLAIPVVLTLGVVFFVVDIATTIVPDSPALYFISSSFIGFTFMLFVRRLSISRRAAGRGGGAVGRSRQAPHIETDI